MLSKTAYEHVNESVISHASYLEELCAENIAALSSIIQTADAVFRLVLIAAWLQYQSLHWLLAPLLTSQGSFENALWRGD